VIKPSIHKHNKKELNPLYSYIKETEKGRKKEYEKFLEHISETLSIPKDVVSGQPIISLTGNHCIRVCNYHSVAEYTTEYIRLLLEKKSMEISGKRLVIESLRKEEIIIVGNIMNISFDGLRKML
jgi:sporulation protein YqfC